MDEHEQVPAANEEENLLVPNWILNVLACLTRKQMANSALSHSCRLFQQLCWPKLHGKIQPHKIDALAFHYEQCVDENNKIRNVAKLEMRLNRDEPFVVVPIAAGIAPPAYILGIDEIHFHFIDQQVLEFVAIILPLLKMCNLILDIYHGSLTRPACPKLRQLFQMLADNGIFEINFLFSSGYFRTFTQTYSGIFEGAHSLLLPFEQADSLTLFNWLTQRRQDGRQKWLNLRKAKRNEEAAFLEMIKKEFCNSKKPLNFAVRLFRLHEEFTLENARTGELLVSYHKQEDGRRQRVRNYLIRYPKGEDEKCWKETNEIVFHRGMESSTILYFPDIIYGCFNNVMPM